MLSNRIIELQASLGMKQTAFAHSIGISQGALSKMLRRPKGPPPLLIPAICHIHNVNPEWLKKGIGPMFLKKPADIINDGSVSYGCNADTTCRAICDACKYSKIEDRDAFLTLTKILKFGEEGTKAAIKQNLKEFVKLVPAPVEPPPPERRKPTQAENDFKLMGAERRGVKTS
jgi:transcriptional regulator with XRE-family HTH domain